MRHAALKLVRTRGVAPPTGWRPRASQTRAYTGCSPRRPLREHPRVSPFASLRATPSPRFALRPPRPDGRPGAGCTRTPRKGAAGFKSAASPIPPRAETKWSGGRESHPVPRRHKPVPRYLGRAPEENVINLVPGKFSAGGFLSTLRMTVGVSSGTCWDEESTRWAAASNASVTIEITTTDFCQ